MTDQLCSNCYEPLLIEVEPDSDVEETKAPAQVQSVPDDVELSCGCHYHWYVLYAARLRGLYKSNIFV